MGGPKLRIAAEVPYTAAEGPYERYALWVQGCPLQCVGCCNPEFFSFSGGALESVKNIAERIAAAAHAYHLEGLTVLGGEPLLQISSLTAVLRAVKALNLGVIVFSGYSLEQAQRLSHFQELWSLVDTLVDGPFLSDSREPIDGRRFVGSKNQRLHHRTTRYDDPKLWQGVGAAEVRVESSGEISVHGSPAQVAKTLLQLGLPARPSNVMD